MVRGRKPPSGRSGSGEASGRSGSGEASPAQSPLDAACRFLGYRPRSVSEVRVWMVRKGFSRADVESTISALKSKGLVDDAAFARYWKESRDSANPRSRSALRTELARKGIDPEVAAGVLDGVDDEAAAYRAAQKRAARLARFDYREFRTKLGGALRRRGFSYEVTEHTVNRLWQESRSNG